MPLVSVVIATYRRPEQLVRAVESVLRQTMTDFEVIVVGERDDTQTPVVLRRFDDRRVRYIFSPTRDGPGAARDVGSRTGLGRWIAFLDDDDEWLPEKLERQLMLLKNDPLAIAMTLSYVVTKHGTFIWPVEVYNSQSSVDDWLFNRRTWMKTGQSMLQTSSLMVPKVIFENLRFGRSRHEEWELVIRATKQFGFRLTTVPESLVIYNAGRTYPWKHSVEWVRSMRDVLSQQAYTGFCLNVATQGLEGQDRNRAFRVLFSTAIDRGVPTAKQLFAFIVTWLIPDRLRQRLRSASQSHRTTNIPMPSSHIE